MGIKANLARPATGGDRDVARDIMGGICDIGIANSYYVGLMRSGAGGPEQQKWGDAIKVILPTFQGGGTQVNVSGASIAKHSPNKAAAMKFLEYLVSDAAQKIYAEANYEYPVKAGAAVHPIIGALGTLKVDGMPTDRNRAVPHRRKQARRQSRTGQVIEPAPAVPRSAPGPSVWLLGSGAIAALVLAPIVVARRLRVSRVRRSLAAPRSHTCCRARYSTPPLLLAGVGLLTAIRRHWRCVARHRVRLPWSPHPRLGASASARRSDLHRRVRLPRPPASCRARADALRSLLGIDSPRDFRLPDVRSMTGCIVLLGFVLYPYVYLTTRAMFLMQAANLIDAARTLGASRGGRVLPRRPAAGAAGGRSRHRAWR